MENYRSNSFKSKQKETNNTEAETKRADKVTTGTVKTKKKSEAHKLKDIFVKGDIEDIKSYAFNDVLVPAVIKAITDIVKNGIDIFFYGEPGRGGKRAGLRTDYRGAYNDGHTSSRVRSNVGEFEMPIFSSREDANIVLEGMDALIETYGIVRVADVFDLAGITNRNYMANKYGWTNLRAAEVVRAYDGYEIRLPRPMPID